MPNIEIDSPLELGQAFYEIVSKEQRIYKPCKLCNNTRRITHTFEDGETYTINCPRCNNKHIKGEEDSVLTLHSYKVRKLTVVEIILKSGNCLSFTLDSGTGDYWSRSTHTFSYIQSLVATGDYFTTKEACESKVKELNKAERERKKRFLNGEDVGED